MKATTYPIAIIFLALTHYSIVSANFGTPCGNIPGPDPCDQSKFLICHSTLKTCQCEVGMQYNVNRCEVKENSSCALNPICIQDAICNKGSKCQCKEGYQPTVGNIAGTSCLKAYNTTCDVKEVESGVKANECHWQLHLHCNDTKGTCLCKDEGLKFEWSKELRSCVGLAGFECSTNGNYCTANATCDTQTRKCACKTGFNNVDGKCEGNSGNGGGRSNFASLGVLVLSFGLFFAFC